MQKLTLNKANFLLVLPSFFPAAGYRFARTGISILICEEEGNSL
jgi:hypothetical protein